MDIGSEKSGEFLGLTNSEQDRLDRNGTVHRASAGYGFKFGRSTLMPHVAIFSEDLDGEAMASTGVDVQLTYLYDGDPITLVLNGFVGQADYDKSNPVFDKTRDDDRYGVMATVYYKNPWGWSLLGSEPMQFFVTGPISPSVPTSTSTARKPSSAWAAWRSAGSESQSDAVVRLRPVN